MNHSALDLLQGELERLYDLDELLKLSAEVLGFAPATVGGTGTKGAFARSLVMYCTHEDALAALVDAILFTSERADVGLRKALRATSNGELSPGTQVGHLKVVRKLAEGGLSVVYLAENAAGEQASLKVIRPEFSKDRAAVHRFKTVSRVMQRLRAPGLSSIVGVGQLDDARPWVAAELITGQNLADRIQKLGPLHINDARPIFEGVLHGLIALHKRGLVHGDVKAENVLVVSRAQYANGSQGVNGSHPLHGEQDLSGVLVDAGEERLLSRSESSPSAASSILPLISSAKAMAPEQARGQEPDARSDVYGFGTLLYEALTGRPPFTGETAIEVIAQHVASAPEPPSMHARRGWISEALDDLVLRALAKDPAERFPDATSVLDALEHVARQPSRRRPLDELAFVQLRNTLVREPSNENVADSIENQAHDSGAWDRAATVFGEAARAANDAELQLSLLFRAARIYESELKNPLRSEAVYQQILQLSPGNQIALNGIETARRHAGDYTGLLEILLDRADGDLSSAARTALLHEIAALYEEKLIDGSNAVVAYTQALVHDPSDQRALRAIERLTAGNETRLGEVLATLSAACEEQHGLLFGDDQAARKQALTELEAAKAELSSVQARLNDQAEARSGEAVQLADSAASDLEARLAELDAEVKVRTAQRVEISQRLRAAESAVYEANRAHEAITAEATEIADRYELLQEQQNSEPSSVDDRELSELGEEVDRLVDIVGQRGAELTAAHDALAAVQVE
ncbi:MAG: hypothetical protein RL701_4629, partial [Pseudomonadota bacterium]